MDVCVTMQDDQTAVLVVTGRVDASNYTGLQAAVDALDKSVERIVFDFRDVEYVSSAGLRVLLSVHKKLMKLDGMKLINVNDAVNDVFEVTGFDEILNYEKG